MYVTAIPQEPKHSKRDNLASTTHNKELALHEQGKVVSKKHTRTQAKDLLAWSCYLVAVAAPVIYKNNQHQDLMKKPD